MDIAQEKVNKFRIRSIIGVTRSIIFIIIRGISTGGVSVGSRVFGVGGILQYWL